MGSFTAATNVGRMCAPPPAGVSVKSWKSYGEYKLKQHAYLVWWEATVLVRKAGIVLLGNLVADGSLQIAGVCLWIAAFLILHARFIPYVESSFNYTEGLSLSTVLVTGILCAVTVARQDSFASFFSTVVMLSLNFATLVILFFQWFRLGLIPLAASFLRKLCCSKKSSSDAALSSSEAHLQTVSSEASVMALPVSSTGFLASAASLPVSIMRFDSGGISKVTVLTAPASATASMPILHQYSTEHTAQGEGQKIAHTLAASPVPVPI